MRSAPYAIVALTLVLASGLQAIGETMPSEGWQLAALAFGVSLPTPGSKRS
jgi:hypothetical protein